MRNRRFGQNLQLFRGNRHVSAFRSSFQQKLEKEPHFAKKHEKSSIWPRLAPFWSKPPCFGVWVKLLVKSCKKCLISRKRMKNLPISPKCKTFSSKQQCFGVWVNFSAKSCKKWLISRKSMKKASIRQKCATFWSKPSCVAVLVNF